MTTSPPASDARTPIALLDGAITGIAAAPPEPTGLPLIVYVPGGGSSVLGVDVPGHSHIAEAVRNGFPAVALNRPAQRDSAPLDLDPGADSGAFAANAERLEAAIAALWPSYADGAPGVVVHGCSIGGAISLHLAARWSADPAPSWPLLGLATSDIGQDPPEEVVATWRGLPDVETIDLLDHLGGLTPPPAWTRAPGLPPASAPTMPIPRAELLEVVGGWPREWREICAGVRVPVHYRLAEHDRLWNVSEDRVAAVHDALRTSSPYVDAAICQGAAHNLPASAVGRSYILEVLAFAHRCLAFERVPQLLG